MTRHAKRILVVDDVPENLELLEARLAAAGYASISARDGASALRLLESERVDAIVSDILMPVMDGYQLCRECKRDPRLRGIPFVFYTATYTSAKDRAFAESLGADAFLVKPTENRRFFQTLEAVLAKQVERATEPSGDAEMDSQDYYRQHNERLTAKLSKKIRDQAVLAAAIEQTSEGVAILSADGGVQYANTTMARRMAAPKDSSPNETLFRDAEGAFHSPAHAAQWLALQSRSRWAGQIRRRTADGSVLDCEESLTPVHFASGDRTAPGNLVSFILVSRDVTEQLRLQARVQIAERMAAIGTLAGGIAHDFNNMLAGIMGLAELTAQDVAEQPEVIENVQQILETCERAKEIVGEVLALTRKTAPELQPIHLAPLVAEVLSRFSAKIPTTIRVESHVLTEKDMVLGNADNLQRAVMNLLMNARQAIGDVAGTIAVTLSSETVSQVAQTATVGPHPAEYLRLSIKDTGRGISTDNLPHIFEPYFTTKRTPRSTGMGLALVHSIVTSHGGEIRVTSHPGEGATFDILLRREEREEPRTRPQPEPEPQRGRERVLIVDDEHVVLDVLQRTLRGLGYTVVSACGLTEAIAVFERESGCFDLVLTDKQMPDGDGFDVVRELRRVRPELPAVLCSGYLEEPDVHRARREGIDDILPKPVRRSQLAECLRAVLAARRITASSDSGPSP